MPAGRRWIFHTLRVANFRGNHVAKFSSDLTMPRESPYCLSRTRLAQIQDACSAYELEVSDARREACLTILCPCDGGLVSMIWDQCAPLCCPRREPRLQRGGDG